jgi:tetratricopeptide (TPR) repeat protein
VLGKTLKQTCSREEVRRLLGISTRQLRGWEKLNLIPPLEVYGFPDIIALRTLLSLRQAKVPGSRIRRAVAALRERYRTGDYPLRELRVMAEAGRITVRMAGSNMEPISGQLLFDFERAAPPLPVEFPGVNGGKRDHNAESKRTREAQHFFQQGVELEQTGGPLKEVVEAYRKALEFDPQMTVAWVNLGTVYFHARAWKEAKRLYEQALELDPEYPLAHFNLGNLYDETGDRPSALAHYEMAIKLNPAYGDAHYNLALLHQSAGQVMNAVHHWKAYLRVDGNSTWAAIARKQLQALYQSAVIPGTRPATSGSGV